MAIIDSAFPSSSSSSFDDTCLYVWYTQQERENRTNWECDGAERPYSRKGGQKLHWIHWIRVDSFPFFFTFFVFTVGLPSNACHAICLTGHSFLCVCVCGCLLSLWRLSTRECRLRSLFDVDHRSPYTLTNHFCLFFCVCCLLFACTGCAIETIREWIDCTDIRGFQKGSLICEKMSERNPFRPTSSGSSGALVTDARLSQLFDPIARLVDAYPPNDRRNGGYHNQRDSSEYTHLTAYPAIIEPVTYDDGTTR